jgi:hypothetical protein
MLAMTMPGLTALRRSARFIVSWPTMAVNGRTFLRAGYNIL